MIGRSYRPIGGWGGAEIGRTHGRSAFSRPQPVFYLAKFNAFGTENLPSPAPFHHFTQTQSQTFPIFSHPHFNDLGPRPSLSPKSTRILEQGPNKQTPEGKSLYSRH